MVENSSRYYTRVRSDLAAMLPGDSHRVLELGCGEGQTLRHLKNIGKAREVVGADIVDLGQDRFLDAFHLVDVQIAQLPYPEGHFDVLVLADVLEHLTDPWAVLQRQLALLRSGGHAVISLPNIREWRVLKRLFLGGDFRYADKGILDRTHLRFFCLKNMRALIEGAGLRITEVSYARLKPNRQRFNALTRGRFEEFLVSQYFFLAVKP